MLLANASHLTEFAGGYTGTCGETALAVALGCALGQPATDAAMLAITSQMRAAGQAASNGASTIAALHDEAVRQGAVIAAYAPYAEPFDFGWQAYLATYAGQVPIVLEFANAQALTDVVTGARDEAGVHYHFICVVGVAASGEYLCADGDNWQVTTRYQTYTTATLAAAVPCAVLALAVPPAAKETNMALPTGWTDDGTTLTAPNGVVLTEGFRVCYLAHPEFAAVAGEPLGAPYHVTAAGMDAAHGPGDELLFQCGGLVWIPATNTMSILWVGAMVRALRQELALASAPTATTPDPATVRAQALVAALKTALQ